MYLMIDNYDSFVYNLKAYFEELGREILVKRSDEITLDEIEDLKPRGNHSVARPKAAQGCRALCRDGAQISEADSYSGSMSWTSGTWILFRCYCGERGTAYAWKGDGGASQRYGAVCRSSGEISCDPVSFSDREAGYASRRL